MSEHGYLKHKNSQSEFIMPRCFLSEFIGAFLLTFVAIVPIVVSNLGGNLSHLDKVAPPGMVVMVLIYCLGNVSGAHFNPAVTFAFALRRAFPWSHVLFYWCAQMTGAIAAAFFVKCMFSQVQDLGASKPVLTNSTVAFQMEAMLTMILVFVILGTAKEHRIVGRNAALAVGATIALCGMIGSPVSGASMNPARSLGPAIVSGHLEDVWIYIAGPMLGALVSVLLTTIIHGRSDGSEAKEAQGKTA